MFMNIMLFSAGETIDFPQGPFGRVSCMPPDKLPNRFYIHLAVCRSCVRITQASLGRAATRANEHARAHCLLYH